MTYRTIKITVPRRALYDHYRKGTSLIVKISAVDGELDLRDEYALAELVYTLNNSGRKDDACENNRTDENEGRCA
ncbi:MAG: hypothetical protein J6A37_10535 [Oscillospiraceae bacterium]|nr:hypothetical protein [Oscillospiraceae bacterium]